MATADPRLLQFLVNRHEEKGFVAGKRGFEVGRRGLVGVPPAADFTVTKLEGHSLSYIRDLQTKFGGWVH